MSNRITIDMVSGQVTEQTDRATVTHRIGTPEAFGIISRAWLRSGWDNKYVYSFTWMGRPIVQLPEDMVRIQEVIYRVRPDVLIETGIAHGGSLMFYASLFKAMGRGRVIGVDIDIRSHNLKAIEQHELFPLIALVEGDSIDPVIVARVKALVRPSENVMVVLDSRHTKTHVLSELRAYSTLVSRGSFIVATDGIMGNLVGAPRSEGDWGWNNPKEAAIAFVEENANFVIEEPEFLFNEGSITERVTYWPNAYLRRVA